MSQQEMDAEYATEEVIHEVWEERQRQDAKWGQQNHPDAVQRMFYPIACAESARGLTEERFPKCVGSYTDILLEEVAEATDEALASVAEGISPEERAAARERLREELIQVAAVAVAWVEKIDRGF